MVLSKCCVCDNKNYEDKERNGNSIKILEQQTRLLKQELHKPETPQPDVPKQEQDAAQQGTPNPNEYFRSRLQVHQQEGISKSDKK